MHGPIISLSYLCSGRSGSEQIDPDSEHTVVVCIAMSFYPYSDAFSGIRSRKLTIKMLLFLSIKKIYIFTSVRGLQSLPYTDPLRPLGSTLRSLVGR
jgi:hypothetical protein